jgi:hypothetical protein
MKSRRSIWTSFVKALAPKRRSSLARNISSTWFGQGVRESDLPDLQPLFQKRIWDRFEPGEGPERLALVIRELAHEDHRRHMEDGSWDQQHFLGAGLREPHWANGEGERALL